MFKTLDIHMELRTLWESPPPRAHLIALCLHELLRALRRRLFNLRFRTTDFGGTRRNLRGEPPRSFGRHATREVREARFRRQEMLDLFWQIFGKHTAIAPRLSGGRGERCRLTKSRPMMSSYKWCVESASTFRYPARAHIDNPPSRRRRVPSDLGTNIRHLSPPPGDSYEHS